MAKDQLAWRKRISRIFWSLMPEKRRLLHELSVYTETLDKEIKEAEHKGTWERREEILSQASYETDPITGRLLEIDT
ncbi:MAG: hypothetical protein WAM05_05835, partial [Candidatus Binataceae bacterium]